MIPYTHKISTRSRSLRIRVELTGEVIVITPPHYSEPLLKKFLTQQQAWIEKALAKIGDRKKHNLNDQSVLIFGKEYKKVVASSTQHPIGVRIEGDTLIINPIPTTTGTDKAINNQLQRFLKATAEKYLIPRTHQLAKVMSISFGSITLREQKTRWGSCSSQGNLNFNWRLVHYLPAIIDYVIIHELAHRIHMNHSAAFWNLVAHYDPEYQKHRGWLKRHGLSVS